MIMEVRTASKMLVKDFFIIMVTSYDALMDLQG